MPWYEEDVVHLRINFIMIARDPDVNMSAACRQFNISRRIGYKWLERYETYGLAGLSDRSRQPKSNPLRANGTIVLELIRLRNKEQFRGPKKLRAKLLRCGFPTEEVPSLATIGRILRRSGMSEAKGRGRPRKHLDRGPLSSAQAPNDVWTVDFKGWWRTRDGKRCEPLTIRDLYSRYLLCLKPVSRRETDEIRTVFELVFKKYGLPKIIRSDNGSPFASITGPCGLTRLSAWWRALGIKQERIEPGHPEQNGGHERMHGDLAREIQSNPSATVAGEESRLERWRREFNRERPHEALGMKVPGEVYQPSSRKMAEAVSYVYPLDFERRCVQSDGCILFHSQSVYLSGALVRQDVGLERLNENCWRVWFCDLPIGELAWDGVHVTRLPVAIVSQTAI
jgi:transposase InsO family protein